MTTTADRPASGVVIVQPARGYRYSADAFLVGGAGLLDGVPDTSIDLGTGCGVLPFLLARRGVRAVGLEIRPEWQMHWQDSLARSDFLPELLVGRVQDLPSGTYDLVTCNPPYAPLGSGPISPDSLKASAHTELDGTLDDFVAAAVRAVAPTGRVAFVVPRHREGELVGLGCARGLQVSRHIRVGERRTVVVFSGEVATRVDETVPARGPRVEQLYACLLCVD